MEKFSRCVRDLPVDDLTKLAFEQRIRANPLFELALNKNCSDMYWAKVAYRQGTVANLIEEMYAIGGLGKSYAMMANASRIGKVLFDPAKHLYFSKDRLIEAAPSIGAGTCVINDEDILDYGMGRMRRANEYENLIQVCRKWELSLINVAVKPRLAEGLAHLQFESLFVDYPNREVHAALYYPHNDSWGVHYEILGYVRFPHPDTIISKDAIIGYEKKKDEFIAENLSKTSGNVYVDIAKEIMQSGLYVKAKEARAGKQVPKSMLLSIVHTLKPAFKMNIEAQQIVACIQLEELLNAH